MYGINQTRHKRSFFDRRDDQDRRQIYDVKVVDEVGYDRRKPFAERRCRPEKRDGWVRVGQWSSVCVAAMVA